MSWLYLSLAIFCSSLLTIIFKFYQKQQIHTSSAIVFNYFTAATLAFIFQQEAPTISGLISENWWFAAIGLALLFISLFNVLAITSQTVGVSEANVANKMTFIFPVLVNIIIFAEGFNFLKIAGILAAIFAIYVSSRNKSEESSINRKNLLLLLTLFVGGGFLDLLLSFSEKKWVPLEDIGMFTGYSFAVAGLIGATHLLINIIRKKTVLNIKNVSWGIFLGLPNYFSIFFFLKALHAPDIESSVVFTVVNMGIIVVSSMLSLVLFKEKINSTKFAAISLASLSILLVSFADKIP